MIELKKLWTRKMMVILIVVVTFGMIPKGLEGTGDQKKN